MTAIEVRDLISNDLWQNTNISAVGVKEFQTLDDAASKLTEAEEKQEFNNTCEALLEESHSNSIAIRYLATITGRHPMDDRYIFTVLEQYYEASKWDEVIFLGNKILTFNESSYALRVLSDCYETLGMQDKKIETWERLVKVDFDETEVLYKLADYYNEKGETQTALNYFRSIIRRHIKAQDLAALKNVWARIVSIKSENSEYLIGLASKIADSMGSEKGAYFLETIYNQGNFDNNVKIKILKTIIKYAPHDLNARDRLIELWKEKYKENPRLDYCLNNTGILQDYLNINLAIEKFEQEIKFVEGAFVYHETWGLGRIKSIQKDEMQILFVTKGLHSMSCSMAYKSLKVLPKNHIWVLKAGVPKDKLAEKFKTDIKWGLKVLLSSLGGEASLKQMKAELVPAVFTEKEYSNWSSAAKKELTTNPYFGISENSSDIYVLRTTPITYEEKALSLFKNGKDIYDKTKILNDFIAHKGQTDGDEFAAMVNFYEGKAQTSSNEAVIAYLILKDLKERYNMSFIHINGTFMDYYNRIENLKAFFTSIQDADLKKAFIDEIRNNVENWQDVLISLYPLYMTTYMADTIKRGPKKNAITRILASSVANYKDDPDFFLYLDKTYEEKEWAKAKCTSETRLFTKLSLLGSVNRKIDNQTDVAENKKRQKTLDADLFSEKQLVLNYINNADEYQAQKLYSMLKGIPDIENNKLRIKHAIATKFPEEWEAITGDNPNKAIDKKKIIPKGLLCSQALFDAKSAELDHIMNVEIPENSKEIGTARELGDLRENAEYQYGKDKQKNLNFMMNKLTDEISVAQVVKPEDVDTNYVCFGTVAVFKDNKTGEEITYTILGPWESDPAKNILNFKAPLGQKLYNLEKGEEAKFNINGVDYDYTVLDIKLADF